MCYKAVCHLPSCLLLRTHFLSPKTCKSQPFCYFSKVLGCYPFTFFTFVSFWKPSFSLFIAFCFALFPALLKCYHFREIYHLIWSTSPVVMLYTLLYFPKSYYFVKLYYFMHLFIFLWECRLLEAGDFVSITEFPASTLVPGTIVDTQ